MERAIRMLLLNNSSNSLTNVYKIRSVLREEAQREHRDRAE